MTSVGQGLLALVQRHGRHHCRRDRRPGDRTVPRALVVSRTLAVGRTLAVASVRRAAADSLHRAVKGRVGPHPADLDPPGRSRADRSGRQAGGGVKPDPDVTGMGTRDVGMA